MSMTKRMILVINEVIPGNKKQVYEELEKLSGISTSAWKHLNYGHSDPTKAMIEFVTQLSPRHASFIAAGANPRSPHNYSSAPMDYEWLNKVHSSILLPAEMRFVAKVSFEKRFSA